MNFDDFLDQILFSAERAELFQKDLQRINEILNNWHQV